MLVCDLRDLLESVGKTDFASLSSLLLAFSLLAFLFVLHGEYLVCSSSCLLTSAIVGLVRSVF
jgi:hypothetical protein